MTPPLHGTPDGEALRREPGAPAPVVQAAPPSGLQLAVAGLASLGISAAGAVSALELVTHSATGYAVIVALVSVIGAVEALKRGLGSSASDDRDDDDHQRDEILYMIKFGNITAAEGERLLAALRPAAQVSAEQP